MDWTVLGWSALAVALVMLATWLVSLPLRNASIVDPVWPLGFVVVGWVAGLTGLASGGDGLRVDGAHRLRHRVGAAPLVPPLPPQRRPRRGLPLRGHAREARRALLDHQPLHRVRHPGPADVRGVAAAPVRRRHRGPGHRLGRPARRRRGGVAARLRLRIGRRRPAHRLQGRPRLQGPGHGQGAVALHPPSQLLRRRLRVVGDLPRGRRCRGLGVDLGGRADRDDDPAAPGLGRHPAREVDGRSAAPATRTTCGARARSSPVHPGRWTPPRPTSLPRVRRPQGGAR